MRKLVTLLLLWLGAFQLWAQEDAWVYFTDKPNATFFLDHPLEMLSQRTLDKRAHYNISIDIKDVPVDENYKATVANQNGVIVLAKSKWLNCLHVRGAYEDLQNLLALPFVSHIQYADHSLNISDKNANKLESSSLFFEKNLESQEPYSYGNGSNQISMLQGDFLHQEGFTGSDMIIAVMDNGFQGVDQVAAFQHLWDENLILGHYNFVERQEDVFQSGTHGTRVLATMGAFVPDELIGTAPNASYYLFVTEANTFENPLEESLWVEAVEYADSLGVDIINTSLGYTTFDNPAYNYNYAAMDGQTTFISRGAVLAATKGLICVTSAGNSGASPWQYISAPGDAPHTLTVGAVNAAGQYATFSSQGPTPDGRVKPDVMAQGQASAVYNQNGILTANSGTSFSSPILAGLVACLWEALPEATPDEIRQLIISSAHLYDNPTNLMGYGIPNFELAYTQGQNLHISEVNPNQIKIWPNPFESDVNVLIPKELNGGAFQIFNTLGQEVYQNQVHRRRVFDLQSLSPGIYFYILTSDSGRQSGKLIKK
jgi:serine protease AprX